MAAQFAAQTGNLPYPAAGAALAGALVAEHMAGRDADARFVRLKGTGYTKKGLRGRARIVTEEFGKAMDRIGSVG